MKRFALILPLMIAAFAPPALAGNIANCEVILMEPMIKDGEDTGAKFASFRPAAEFLSSVYDGEEGHATQLDEYDIRGVMCKRREIIPTLRDFPILATGIPFSVSENFDAVDSNLMTLYFKDDEFRYSYSGAELTQKELSDLTDVMEIFNLQPHNLGATSKQKPITQEQEEMLK